MLTLALPAPAFADHEVAETWGSSALTDPSGVATDRWDNVYVADFNGHQIKKFSPDGELLDAWGSGLPSSVDGQFNHPKDVVVDSTAPGHLYVADKDNNRIQKFTLNGLHVASFVDFNQPYSVAVADGFLYVADYGNHRIQRLTATGVADPPWGSFGTGNGQFDGPTGVAVSASGTVYVTDDDTDGSGNNRVQYFSSDGTYQGQWSTASNPVAVDVSSAGVFVAMNDGEIGRVTQFATSGSPPAEIDTWTSEFFLPQGVALGSLNQLFVSDLTNRIRRLDAPLTGSVVRTSGTRLIFEAKAGNVVNGVEIERLSPTTFRTIDPGNELTGGGGCSGPVGGTINCAFPDDTTAIRVSTKDGDDSIRVIGSTPSVMDGGDGNDVLNGVDGSNDVASYASYTSSSGPGATVDLTRLLPQDTVVAGTDWILGVEGVTGTARADTLSGNGSSNSLSGGDGNDVLNGRGGDDTLSGAEGSDRVDYSTTGAGVTVNLASSMPQNTGGAGVDTLSGIEHVTGTDSADTITGSPGVNDIVCLDGVDTVTAELQDTVAADCDTVIRSDATPPGGSPSPGSGTGGVGGTAPAPAPGATAPAGAPVLSGLAVTRMRTGKPGTFSYSLDQAAAVTIAIERIQPGRKVGRTCKKQTRANRRRPRCTMFVPVGKLTHAGAAGRNTLRFSGKLSGRALKPGLYRATATATGPSGAKSSPTTAKFAVSR